VAGSDAPAGPLARASEPRRVVVLAKLKNLQQRLAAGKLTPAEYQMCVADLINQLEARNDNNQAKLGAPKVRGPDRVRERLLRARRTGELDAEAVDFALWLLEQNPRLAHDLALSLRSGGPNAPAGTYGTAQRMVTLFKGVANAETAVHEILHHSERMMPPEAQKAIVREWVRAWTAAWKAGDAEVRSALDDMLAASVGDRNAMARMRAAFDDGKLDYDTHYPLVNASEFWAVHGTEILGKRAAAGASWIARAPVAVRVDREDARLAGTGERRAGADRLESGAGRRRRSVVGADAQSAGLGREHQAGRRRGQGQDGANGPHDIAQGA
jgi:hypothetical protein